MATINGNPGMIEQPKRKVFTQRNGWQWVRTWKGAKRFADGKGQELIAAGYDVSITEFGPTAIVECVVGTQDDADETPVDSWERQVNRIEKSIFEHPVFAGLTEATRRAVRRKFEIFQSPEEESVDVLLTGDAALLYERLTKGIEMFVVEQPVVRLTQTVSNRYARSAARANIGSILSYAKMKSVENAPEAVLDNKAVPSGISSIASYGYRKGDPTITQQANNKWQIVTEWEAGFWDTLLYTFV
jgi:hypothetical protein